MYDYPIDYVFTYVDQNDKEWFKQYKDTSYQLTGKVKSSSVRYRDWGTLKYLLRGIAKCMPWIRNVYMIVQQPSQVPNWVNTNTVKVVFHNQIIPKAVLPTYNSNCIELFMHRIPGLAEHFIYGNDDMFPINKTQPEDWYDENGNPKIKVRQVEFKDSDSMYRHMLKSTTTVCESTLGLKHYRNKMCRADHSINPMLVSVWKKVWKSQSTIIKESISTFRKPVNVTQEVSNFYSYLSGQCTRHNRVNKYFEFNHMPADRFREYLFDNTIQNICMNDNNCDDFNRAKKVICGLFEEKFPRKCKYEL